MLLVTGGRCGGTEQGVIWVSFFPLEISLSMKITHQLLEVVSMTWVWKHQPLKSPCISLEERNGNSLQYSCLKNFMDRGGWQATVHGVAKSWTWLSDWTHTFLKSRRWYIQQGEGKNAVGWVRCCFRVRISLSHMFYPIIQSLHFTPQYIMLFIHVKYILVIIFLKCFITE